MSTFSFVMYFLILIGGGWILGKYMTNIFKGKQYGWLKPVYALENGIYRLCGIHPSASMGWKEYAASCLLFNLFGFLFLFTLLMTQQWWPLNPQNFPNLSWHLSFNTAVSFMTNTNWQAYSGESTLSYLSQMLGLTVQNFVSAAVGMAVLLALIRGFSSQHLGNFWVDLVRSCLYVLLPLSLILALILISQGVVQSFQAYQPAVSVEGAERLIPLGPAASQIAIKQLGTNGGGFFGVNSAHSFENPTPLSNFFQMISILLIPVAQVFMFGFMIRREKEGVGVLSAMFILLLMGLAVGLWAEFSAHPIHGTTVNLEGKELRNGIADSVLWATTTTAASNGSVNAMHDSLNPLAGMVAIINMVVGEVILGGVGVGLIGMFMMVLLTVFIAGLMVGRTPEYLGKKIEASEIKLVLLVIIVPGIVLLAGAALSCLIQPGYSSVTNPGPHGLSQILYAFASAVGNNGSAFAGLGVNTPYYNTILGVAMLIGRFVVIVPCLMLAGLLVKKQTVPQGPGTLATDTPLFVMMLVGIVLIVGALTYFPALLLGPVSEHMLMIDGRAF